MGYGQKQWAQQPKFENIIASANKTEPAHNGFYSKEAPYMCHLQIFGKHGIVHDAQTIKNKLDNHRETCIFVGYAANDHVGNVYQLFNPQIKHMDNL